MKKIIFTSILFLVIVGVSFTNNPEPIKKKKQVYLFAGQSNMDGRANGGDLSEKDLARLEKVAHRIEFYFNHKPVSLLQLTKATKFIAKKFGSNKIFGPELFFGIEMADNGI